MNKLQTESSSGTFLRKENLLFLILGAIFLCNAILAEFIGVKIFSLERTFGLTPINLHILGFDQLSFNLTFGVILWPVVFVLTDILNEYYGMKGVRLLSYTTVAMILYSFLVVKIAIEIPPADFWPHSHLGGDLSGVNAYKSDVKNLDSAFRLVYGQGLYIIIGSVVAFLISQVLDVFVFHSIKRYTGEKSIWLRATGSTIISQLIDSFVVLFIAFYIGAGWSMQLVLAICVINYIYKFSIAVLATPILYLIHSVVERYLGHELATAMRTKAMQKA
jgi:uncharacterized PurR-regulated membrane protein YhhQ (DUF165 family)